MQWRKSIAQTGDWAGIACPGGRSTYDPELSRAVDCVGAPLGAELLVKAGEVGLHRVGRDLQPAGNLLVGAAGGQLLQHNELTRADAERGDRLWIAVERGRPPRGEHPNAEEDAERQERCRDQGGVD